MTGPYHDHIIGAPDVCNNCFRVIRVERVDPSRSGIGREYETSFERHRRHTDVDFGPAEVPPESKGVFCECGVESARDRVWGYAELPESRFKTLLQHALETLEHKDVSIDARRMAEVALAAWRAGHNVDSALEAGLDAGLARAVVQS